MHVSFETVLKMFKSNINNYIMIIQIINNGSINFLYKHVEGTDIFEVSHVFQCYFFCAVEF